MTEPAGRPQRDWAALIYIAGDNDLSDRGLADIQEICDAKAVNPGGEGLNSLYVGVEIDTRGEHEGSIRYEINDEGYRVVIARLGEHDSGSPKTLAEFLKWGVERFPAKNYLAVVWGHGSGFKDARSLAMDENGTWMDMAGVRWAFDQAGLAAGSTRNLAVVGFDACLMGMAEIAYSLQGLADLLVGSQQIEPGDGWPYVSVLDALKRADRVKDAASLGSEIVRLYVEFCEREGLPNVTQSAIKLVMMEEVMARLGALGRELTGLRASDGAALSQARAWTLEFNHPDYIDLVDFCDALLASETLGVIERVAAAAAAARKTAQAAIEQNSPYGPNVDRAHGMSIWFPTRADLYAGYRNQYLALGTLPCVDCGVIPGRGLSHKSECESPGAVIQAGFADWVGFLDRYHGYAGLTYQQQPSALSSYPGEDRRQTTITTEN